MRQLLCQSDGEPFVIKRYLGTGNAKDGDSILGTKSDEMAENGGKRR